MKKYFYYLFVFSYVMLSSSCMSKKNIVYLQGTQDFKNASINYEPIIQNDDKLSILVSSIEMEATAPFNLNQNQSVNSVVTSNNNSNSSSNSGTFYLVDNKGNIDFPVLGTLSVSGFSIDELKSLLKKKLALYLKDPVVNITISNFKVTVLGDVQAPGVKNFSSHRVTLFDALGMAGDLTIYGKRYNILIVRDYQGIKSFNRIDISKADFVNSPFYYLDQNDVVYVEPRKAKIDASSLPNIGIIASVTSLLITLLLLATR